MQKQIQKQKQMLKLKSGCDLFRLQLYLLLLYWKQKQKQKQKTTKKKKKQNQVEFMAKMTAAICLHCSAPQKLQVIAGSLWSAPMSAVKPTCGAQRLVELTAKIIAGNCFALHCFEKSACPFAFGGARNDIVKCTCGAEAQQKQEQKQKQLQKTKASAGRVRGENPCSHLSDHADVQHCLKISCADFRRELYLWSGSRSRTSSMSRSSSRSR